MYVLHIYITFLVSKFISDVRSKAVIAECVTTDKTNCGRISRAIICRV